MRIKIIAFVIGVALLQIQGSVPVVQDIALLVASAALLILVFSYFQQRAARLVLLLACATLGFGWAAWFAQQRLADRLPEALEGRDLQLVGVVAALPQHFERGERFEFVVESANWAEWAGDVPGSAPLSGGAVPQRVMLSWYRGLHEEAWHAGQGVHPGERWRFTVRLKRPHGNANPHGFDYEAWLFERGIRATGYIRPRTEALRLDSFVAHPAYAVERLRDVIRSRFFAVLPDAPYVGVLVALAVGDQRVIPNAQWKIFNRTGITHLVSISGLHVTMVAALFAALVGGWWRRSEVLALRLPAQKAAVVAGWLAALAYTLLAGSAVPAQRTLCMLSVVALTLWSARNAGASRTLLLALLAVLLLDPWAVLSAGFWLSFGAVGLLFFVGTARIGNVRGWRAQLAQWGATQWAVTVGSLPLLLLLFQQFSLVSPLANALAIPFVSFVVTPLTLLFAVLPWPPLLHFDHWLLAQLMLLLEWLADWPVWQQAAPPWWASLLAGLGVLWLLLPRGFPARWPGLCLLLPALFWPVPRPAAGEAWIEVLDVGQGLAVVVRTAQHALLYDTGPLYSAESDAGQRIVVPFLRASGVERLDALVVTHRDADHSGGLAAVQDAVPIARTLTSMPGLPGERCANGQSWVWDGVRFTMLYPETSDYRRPVRKTNNMSCVLRVENVAGSVLLTSDIEAVDEQALLGRSPALLRSDVLLVPHHGSRTSSTPEFVAAVGAREVIFPVGYRNRFNHPRPDVVERYSGSRLWRTDRDGAVRVTLGSAPSLVAYRQLYQRYWHGQ
ncbi:MAG: DNA internalization-related competence protein ComEC/Rec2 [Rhodocyclaceae bacterium]